MGTIKDKRKFKRKESGSNLTNPTKNEDLRPKKITIDAENLQDKKEK